MDRLTKNEVILALCAVALSFALSGQLHAQEAATRNSSEIVDADVQLPESLGTYSDVDNLNPATLKNWYDDLNGNGSHDPGEPFAAIAQAEWLNPAEAPDASCWLAAAVNMLKQLGKVNDPDALYQDYARYGVPSPAGTLTWDDGGLQEYVIAYWASQHPGQPLHMEILRPSSTVRYADGHYAWKDIDIRSAVADYLADGWAVGIGLAPLYGDRDDDTGLEAVDSTHALTVQAVPPQFDPPWGALAVTDPQRDHDWSGPGDLNTYADWTYGPTPYRGHTYYAWFNDYYSGNWDVWPDGDVGYVVAAIPEPQVWVLTLGAAAMWVAFRSRRFSRR